MPREREARHGLAEPKSSTTGGGEERRWWVQTELELLFLAMEFRWEKVRLEREKREKMRGGWSGWNKKKKKKESDGSGQPDPVFFSETLPGSKIGPGCPPHLTQSDPRVKQKL